MLEILSKQPANVVNQFHQSFTPESLFARLAAIHASRSLRRKRHVPPSLNAGIFPSAARRYTVRLPAFRYWATSSKVMISKSGSAIACRFCVLIAKTCQYYRTIGKNCLLKRAHRMSWAIRSNQKVCWDFIKPTP